MAVPATLDTVAVVGNGLIGHGMAQIFAAAGLEPSLTPVTTAEYPTPARRPPYSVLATERMVGVRGRPLRDWRAAVRTYLAELGELAGAGG